MSLFSGVIAIATKVCNHGDLLMRSNSHYETDFGVSNAEGIGYTKIGFLKARLRRAFKKPIFIMRNAA
jgi:hypothetical protein